MCVLAWVLAQVAYLCLHLAPLLFSRNFRWDNFRNYFDFDQYSYLAIAVNVRDGNFADVEPFTETGVSHYPRLYYVLVGLTARVLGTDIIATWQLVGLAFQLAMVTAITWLFIRLSGKPLLGVLGFVPSVVGTLAAPSTNGEWLHSLENHGVLWGAFGTLFTLNAEAAGLSVAVAAGCVLIGATFPLSEGGAVTGEQKWRDPLIVAACFSLGFLANVQTYSFLTAIYLLTYVAASYGLLTYGQRPHAWSSAALLILALTAGPVLAEVVSPLASLLAGLGGAVPGLLLLAHKHRRTVLGGALAIALSASPSVLRTVMGLAGDDDFLVYREASTENLGVPLGTGLLAASVPILVLALILWQGVKTRHSVWTAIAIGSGVAWLLVAGNDVWGVNQEPYRFWIDAFVIVTATSLPVLGQVVFQAIARVRRERRPGEALQVSVPLMIATAGGLALWAAIAVSFLDYQRFATYVSQQGTAAFDDPQALAIKDVSRQMTNGAARLTQEPDSDQSPLVLSDPCISPSRFKALTGFPTAFYNKGLAWPTQESKFRELLSEREADGLRQDLAEDIGVKYIVTDSSCDAQWENVVIGTKVAQSSYTEDGRSADVAVWRIGP
jgi:hypothetical protein